MNGPIAWYHGRFIHSRRVNVLTHHLTELILKDAKVLDIGCGDGWLSSKIAENRNDVSVQGLDVLVRSDAFVEVTPFDGDVIPFGNDSFDTVMMIDVLHHTVDPLRLLSEAARVAKRQIVLKDHFLRGTLAFQTLAMMDRTGNSRHGVELPFNYQTPSKWTDLYHQIGWSVTESREQLGLYANPLSWFFERGLHFITALQPNDSESLR